MHIFLENILEGSINKTRFGTLHQDERLVLGIDITYPRLGSVFLKIMVQLQFLTIKRIIHVYSYTNANLVNEIYFLVVESRSQI